MAKKYSQAVKRFGTRYGKRVRERLGKVESIAKSKHKCPYCNYVAVKKESMGIFHCSKCNAKFTGRAFSPVKKKTKKQQKTKEYNFNDELFTKKQQTKDEDEQYAIEAAKNLKKMEKGEDDTQELPEQELAQEEVKKE
ncbi:MAG: hypothetical protein ACQESF_03770 [Nanobdellota archaeon]